MNKLEQEVIKRNISNEDIATIISNNRDLVSRRIISGMASVDTVDREGQRIPIFALKEAVDNFMQNTYYRPVQIFHSDITVGRVVPKWTNPKTGEIHKTEIVDSGWRIVAELRDDLEIANKTWEEIVKGNLRSFSIAGSSNEKLQKQENGVNYEQIKSLAIAEISVCEIPVNPLAKFEILWDPNRVEI